MFRANKKHKQTGFFGIQNSLPEKLQKRLEKSSSKFFYNTIFCKIREEDFRVLYSDKASRPNAPINCLVAALILKQKYDWSYDELFDQILFNLLTKVAMGLDTLDDIPFNQATIFNFQTRLMDYQLETGINLVEQVFDSLTRDQLNQLKLKTDIQRCDSVMATSNVRGYSRLQLLVEVLLRLWKILDEDDKSRYSSKFSPYTNNRSSGYYIYKLKPSQVPHELEQIAEIYQFCKTELMPKYSGIEFSRIFDRVYTEHFTEVEDKIGVRPSSELNSSCLQSPDDADATYRIKRDEEYRGQSINVVETASQDNPLNLIIDVAVSPNNVDDAQVLTERIDIIKEKTPDLKEMHSDGAYGNPENDKKFEEYGITHVQTAVRGRQCEVDIEIKQVTDDKYLVTCPFQSAESQPSGKQYKALFNKELCLKCQLSGKCPAVARKSSFAYYFKHEDYLRNKRLRSLQTIPRERWKIRPNVEATIHEFSCRLTNGKLKVRGAFKTGIFAFCTAIAINFGRIFRYMTQNPKNTVIFSQKIAVSFLYFVQIVKELLNCFRNLKTYYFSISYGN